ncbi:MAG: ParB/RepB/Spo0J family partition protein [Bacteroidota bacterium]
MKTPLGRGLDALINPQLKDKIDAPVALSSKDIHKDDGKSYDILAKISADQISPNPFQPRTNFDAEALEELKKSILENGLIQPITVRRINHNKYELISGERRLRACKEIGVKEIPAYIIKVESKEAMLALSLIENIQREKLNPIEMASAFKRLMEECNLSQEEIAAKVGKDRSTITNFIRLLKLPQKVQQSLVKDEITSGHARALISLPNELMQIELLEKIIKKSLPVRKVEELVRNIIDGYNGKKKKSTGSIKYDQSNISQRHLEERIQSIIGTKVYCKIKKNGSGDLIIEFYSQEELERLIELFEKIGKTYN